MKKWKLIFGKFWWKGGLFAAISYTAFLAALVLGVYALVSGVVFRLNVESFIVPTAIAWLVGFLLLTFSTSLLWHNAESGFRHSRGKEVEEVIAALNRAITRAEIQVITTFPNEAARAVFPVVKRFLEIGDVKSLSWYVYEGNLARGNRTLYNEPISIQIADDELLLTTTFGEKAVAVEVREKN